MWPAAAGILTFIAAICAAELQGLNGANAYRDWSFDAANPASFEFGQYHSYDEMIQFMTSLSNRYPNKAKEIIIGSTTEGRSIVGLKIGSNAPGQKRSVYIDGGIHGHDWLPSGVVLYIMGELAIRSETDPKLHDLLDNLDWYLFPTVNPDGYEYSRSGNANARSWRKNRSVQNCSFYECCFGVDLNRNFDAGFATYGTSKDPCDDNYPGPNAFSEPESQAIRDTITRLQDSLKAMISLHSYGQTWLIPFGNAFPPKYPKDYAEMESAAKEATKAVSSVHGRLYIPQNSALGGLFAGAADDWTKAKFPQIPYVYTVEVRPQENDYDVSFDVFPAEIVPTGEEIFAGIKVIANRIINSA